MLLPRILFACLMMAGSGAAHPADVSALRVQVERQRLEFRFTFTLLTLGRMVELDRNLDQKLDTQELQLVRGDVESFLHEHVLLKVNGQSARLGDITKMEHLWPPVDSVDLREVDRAVDVSFELASPVAIGSVSMEFTGLQKMGDEATIQATFEQGDLRMQVPFSRGEPDYQYDTGFAVEDLFKAPTEASSKLPNSTETVAWQTARLPWGSVLLMGFFLVPLFMWIFRRNKDR